MPQNSKMTRREALVAGALGSAGTLVAGCATTQKPIDPLSDESLIASSALSGTPLSAERVQAQRVFFTFMMRELALMREFDPGDDEPPAVFPIE